MARNLVKALVFLLIFSTSLKISAQDLQTIILNRGSSSVDFTVDPPRSTIIEGESFSIPEGQVIEIVFACGTFSASTSNRTSTFSFLDKSQFPIYICGPTVLKNYSNFENAIITYRIKNNISTTTTIPTSADVIPTDATGPVNVILESSTDLVTWTAANPGTYGASTTKRFFRVRAVNQ
jgi:hypothetical protein